MEDDPEASLILVDPFQALANFSPEDEFSQIMLPEMLLDGVPASYALEVQTKLVDWTGRLNEEGLTDDVLTALRNNLAEAEEAHPGAPLWDLSREFLGGKLIEAGHEAAALDLLYDIRSSHRMAASLILLSEYSIQLGGSGRTFARQFAERLKHGDDLEKYLRFTRAFADHTIDIDPDSEAINTCEEILAEHEGAGFDPLQSWADSQRQLHPDVDWDNIVTHIKDEEQWVTVGLNFRRFAMRRYLLMAEALRDSPEPNLANRMQEEISDLEARYPEVMFWDQMRYGLAKTLLANGPPHMALEFGLVIKNAVLQQELVIGLLDVAAKEQAFELATQISNPKIKVETLLSKVWGQAGFTHLSEIIQGPGHQYSFEERLYYCELIRDWLTARGEVGEAAAWQAVIEETRRAGPDPDND